MKRCLLLTHGTESADDRLVCRPLLDLGWDVSFRTWTDVPPGPDRNSVPSSDPERRAEADIVVIRSTWDYHHRAEVFLDALEQWNSRNHLENSLRYVRWNCRKTYLADLRDRGIPIAPTLFFDHISISTLEDALMQLGPRLVIKPQISASSEGTFQVTASSLASEWPDIERALTGKPSLCQSFVDSIVEEGEYSLIFFAGRFSHAVMKTPDRGDFRVQEEFGGTTRPVVPERELVLAAERAITAAREAVGAKETLPPLYARVDMARSNDRSNDGGYDRSNDRNNDRGNDGGYDLGNDRRDEYWLMELELIEPGLFLGTDPEAPSRFAVAIDARVRE